ARACREISGCADMMIGRGALTDPWLARKIKAEDLGVPDEWPRRRDLLWRMLEACRADPRAARPDAFAVARAKQMLRAFAKDCEAARATFERVKIMKTAMEVRAELLPALYAGRLELT